MDDAPDMSNVINLVPRIKRTYDRSRIEVLKNLPRVKRWDVTVLGGDGFTDEQVWAFIDALRADEDLWCFQVLNKQGDKATIFCDQLPPSRLIADP